MSVGRITIVTHSPYFPIGEYLTRCETKQPANDGYHSRKAVYLVRFAGSEPRDAGIATAQHGTLPFDDESGGDRNLPSAIAC
jgi:hypothetical protein